MPRGADIQVRRSKEEIISNPDKEKQMIDAWLKKNKPSTRFEDEPKMGHVTPEPTLGTNMPLKGEFF